MKILIVTQSFVREVVEFLRYVETHSGDFRISVVIPDHERLISPFPAAIRQQKLWFPWHIRAACFSPRLLHDLRAIRPDILHIFEECSGMIAFQTVLFRNLCRLKSRMFVYSAENIPGNVHPFFRLPMAYVMRQMEHACVCSSGVKSALEREGFTKPITVFPLGVNQDVFRKFAADHVESQLNIREKFVLGYVGKLLESKGIFLLLDALRELPQHVHLLMVGTGEDAARFREQVSASGLTARVHLVGHVPYEELPEYMNCMDIGIVPSLTTPRWKEQLGRAILELMSCEVPVIGSDSGAIPEVIGNAGYIFQEHDTHELLTRILQLMSSPDERRRIGQRGRDHVRRHYSIAVMAESFLDMYRAIADKIREGK